MASNVRIHNPYVLATLPRPLDQTDGRLVARPVFGVDKDGVKRQRPEVAAGIDGEAVNIYHVSASRLVTSYPIPPHGFFVCPPCSVRIRCGPKDGVSRYTYAAMRDVAGTKITLFKDSLDPAGKWESVSLHHKLNNETAGVIHLDTIGCRPGKPAGWLVAVCGNGNIVCLDGDSLSEVWVESSKTFIRDAVADSFSEYSVFFATFAYRRKGQEKLPVELLHTTYPNSPRLETDSHLLVLVANLHRRDVATRYVMMLGINPNALAPAADSPGPRFTPLQIAPVPVKEDRKLMGQSTYQFHAASGGLMELHEQDLDVIDLSSAVPRLHRTIQIPNARTFIPLSPQSVLSCSSDSAAIHNHVLRSVQAKVSFSPSEIDPALAKTKDGSRLCTAVGFFRTLDLAVVLLGNSLVSIPVEPLKGRGMKRRLDGQLIDAIGRGEGQSRGGDMIWSSARLENHIDAGPGIKPGGFDKERQHADSLLGQGAMRDFETLMASKFGVNIETAANQNSGDDPECCTWSQDSARYTDVDRRWILYAIGRALSVQRNSTSESPVKLVAALSNANIVTYLVVAGHLTTTNLRAALGGDLAGTDTGDSQLAEGLMRVLGQIDPTQDLFVKYIFATRLEAPELLVAIRELMQSLDLAQHAARETTRFLTIEPHSASGDSEKMELDKVEDEEMALANFHLGDEAGVRTRGLTTALTKLGCCPALATVKAMRAMYQPDEILTLIYLLRVELVKGAWTSRYTNVLGSEESEMEPPPDGALALIANLLSRCLDSVGPKAWFINDGVTGGHHSGAGDFFAALRLEVKAALEGLEEAVYLNGIVTEAVRFGSRACVTKAEAVVAGGNKPTTVHFESKESHFLPLGVRKSQSGRGQKVVPGGEVVLRSKREMGHLKSKKVGPYSLEKLTV